MRLLAFATGATLLALIVPAASFAQSPAELAEASGAPSAPAGWTVPRTEWGDPDLTGIWPIDSVGRTPT